MLSVGTMLLVLAMGSSAGDNVNSIYLDCLKDFERYAESIWHDATYPNSPPDAGYFGDGHSDGNGGIRGACGVAVGYAVLVRAFPDDPKKSARLDRIRKVLNYAAHAHASGTSVCVDKKKWGVTSANAQSTPTDHGWQSGMWAGSMGLACLLVQDQFPPATVAAVKHALAEEANCRAAIPPASGYQRDTKAEENAWNANCVALAAAWMAEHTNAPLWLKSAKQYLVNSYSVANTNGDPLASWVSTVTLFPSFAVENHGFYHPSYQLDPGASMGDSFLMAQIANSSVAAELRPFAEHNVLNVWRHFRNVILDSGEVGYPSGLDWSLHTYEHNTYLAYLATHFNEPLARFAEHHEAALLRYRQLVNGDGRFVGDSLPDGFYHEAVDARHVAISWLHNQYGRFPTGPGAPPAPHFAHSPDIKLITQGGPAGFFSVSYGARIMGLIVPPARSVPANPYVTTPRHPGLIGIGALGRPASAELIRLQTNAMGFEAELSLSYKAKGTTAIYVKCSDGAIAIIEVPAPTAGVPEAKSASFSVGIENHALTGGSREIKWADGAATIVERSGKTLNLSNRWACVSGQLGLVAGPAGHIHYQAATTYNRRGAAEDTLEFVPEKSLRPRYAVWFPGQNARDVQSLAARVDWKVSGTNAVLTFPGASGTLQQLNALVPP